METNVLRQDPGGCGQEHPSGALRDEVSGDNPPHGVGGTSYGIRRCQRGVTNRPHREKRIALPFSPGREKEEMTECENRKRKCVSLSQDTNFTPFLDPYFNANTRPLKKPSLRQKTTYSPSKLLKYFEAHLLSKPCAALSHREKLILSNYKHNLFFSLTNSKN